MLQSSRLEVKRRRVSGTITYRPFQYIKQIIRHGRYQKKRRVLRTVIFFNCVARKRVLCFCEVQREHAVKCKESICACCADLFLFGLHLLTCVCFFVALVFNKFFQFAQNAALGNFQSQNHHFVEGVLAFFGGKRFARDQMIGNGANAQCVFACARCV